MIKNTLVILNYNDADTVVSLLRKIQDYTAFDRIVVVDNSSTDNSYKSLKQLASDKVHVILTDYNGGYAYGNNTGIFYAINTFNTKYITVANPDIFVEEKVVYALINFLEKNKDCGMVAPKVHKGYNAWHLPGYPEIVLSLFVFPRWLFKALYRKVYLDGKSCPVRVGVVEGSLFCARAELMKDIKGYDERTFLYGEENILSQKMKKAEYKNYILPQYKYEHYHSISVNKSISQKKEIFKYKYDSYKIYCKDYLQVSRTKLALLDILYKIAYLERYVYDVLFKLCKKEKIYL